MRSSSAWICASLCPKFEHRRQHGGAKLVEGGCLEQELLDFTRLVAVDLVQQVVAHLAIRAVQPGDQLLRLGLFAQADCRQGQAGSPAFRFLLQLVDRSGAQGSMNRLVEIGQGFGIGKTQIGRANFHHPALDFQPAERQGRAAPGGEDQVHRHWLTAQQVG